MQKVSRLDQSCRARHKAPAAPVAIASVETQSSSQISQPLRQRSRHGDAILPAVPAHPRFAELGDRPEEALNIIVEEAIDVCGADGAAIAVDSGMGFQCCARAGLVAPPLGTPLNTNAGLSGECFRTGKVVCSIDTERDPRVDIAACRQASIRSAMIVPIYRNERLIGMLTVLSSHAAAFGPGEMSRLQGLASLAPETWPAVERDVALGDEESPAAFGGAILPLQRRPAAPVAESAAIEESEFKRIVPSVTPRVSAGSGEIGRCLDVIRQDPALRLLGHVKTYLRIENLYDGSDRTHAIDICERLMFERAAEIGVGLKGAAEPHPPAR